MQRTLLANRIAGAVGLLEQILNYICILNRIPYLFYGCAGIPIDTRILVSVA
jgi:hypothetical protein